MDVVHTDINRSALSITFGSCLINVNRSQFLMKCLHKPPHDGMFALSSRSEIAEDLPPQGPSFQRLHGESDFYLLKLPHHSIKHNRYFERGLGAVDTETDFFETALFQRRSQRKKTCLHKSVFKTIPVYTDTPETTENGVVSKPGLVWRHKLPPLWWKKKKNTWSRPCLKNQ